MIPYGKQHPVVLRRVSIKNLTLLFLSHPRWILSNRHHAIVQDQKELAYNLRKEIIIEFYLIYRFNYVVAILSLRCQLLTYNGQSSDQCPRDNDSFNETIGFFLSIRETAVVRPS